jgi:hypothetical protein
MPLALVRQLLMSMSFLNAGIAFISLSFKLERSPMTFAVERSHRHEGSGTWTALRSRNIYRANAQTPDRVTA